MQKSSVFISALALVASAPGSARADLELPHTSPSAHVGLTVGLTDISVDYSSPAVKGRKIWGGLVPYGQVWRTGANNSTRVTFGKDVVVGDKPIAAGSYGLYTIPGASSWTIILNKGASQPGLAYKQADDVLRFEVRPKVAPMREHMTFLFNDFNDGAAAIDLEWEKLRVSIPVKAKTDEQVAAGIKAMSDNAWRPYANAARYLLDSRKDGPQALELVDKSIAIHEDWLNVWVKAALLAQKGDYKAAYPLAEKAQALGAKSPQFFLEAEVKKALVDWKGKT